MATRRPIRCGGVRIALERNPRCRPETRVARPVQPDAFVSRARNAGAVCAQSAAAESRARGSGACLSGRMRILLLAPQPFYSERGTPIAIRLAATALCNAGHAVDILTYHEGEDVRMENLRVLRIPKPPGIT